MKPRFKVILSVVGVDYSQGFSPLHLCLIVSASHQFNGVCSDSELQNILVIINNI